MSVLFRVFKGPEEELQEVPFHDGYAYFTIDKGNLFIDTIVVDEEGEEHQKRVQINAENAQGLIDQTGETVVTIDDLVLSKNVDNGGILVGDSETGTKSLTGIGALYALTSGAPTFDTLPIEAGGTGGTTAKEARENLDVYSKDDVDQEIGSATTTAWTETLLSDGWLLDSEGDKYTYSYNNVDLFCGKDGNVPPIITCISNLTEYSKISYAEATVNEGIVFASVTKPENDIGIIIIDNR